MTKLDDNQCNRGYMILKKIYHSIFSHDETKYKTVWCRKEVVIGTHVVDRVRK